MKYNTAKLDNGLRIIHLPNSSKIAYCGYQINAGTRNEENGDEGLAHFCEHMTFKGTRKLSATAIANKIESVGGDLNAFTNKEDTVFYAAVPVQHFHKAVSVLSDMVFDSIYPQDEICKEVEVICDEIESYNDSPAELIYDEFENLVFRGHPLGHNILGTSERVRNFNTADAVRFTQRYYRPDNAVFFVYGDIDFKKLVKTLARLTPDMVPYGAETCCYTLPEAPLPAKTIIHHDTHQTHVMIGNRAYHAGHPLRIPLYLLNNILGGTGMNARLNVILRERRGLVYTVESSMVCYGDTGLWSVYFGCDPHDVSRCIRLVKAEMQRFADRTISEKALSAAKKQLKGQLAIACDNNENFALDFGKCFLHSGDEKDIDSLYAKIDGVTAVQIQQVAKEIFCKDSLATLIIN